MKRGCPRDRSWIRRARSAGGAVEPPGQSQLVARLRQGERTQAHRPDPGQCLHACEPLAAPPLDPLVVQAPRHRDGHVHVARQDVLQQVEGGRVRHVQVLHHHGEGARRREPGEHRRDGGVEVLLGEVDVVGRRRGSTQLGQEPGERLTCVGRAVGQRLADPPTVVRVVDRPEQLHHRHERDLGGEREAAPDSHAGVGEGRRRVDERRLADAGLAGHHQEAAAPVQVVAHDGELGAATGDPGRRRGSARRRPPTTRRARGRGTPRGCRPSPPRGAPRSPRAGGRCWRRPWRPWCGRPRCRVRASGGWASRPRGAARAGPGPGPGGRPVAGPGSVVRPCHLRQPLVQCPRRRLPPSAARAVVSMHFRWPGGVPSCGRRP